MASRPGLASSLGRGIRGVTGALIAVFAVLTVLPLTSGEAAAAAAVPTTKAATNGTRAAPGFVDVIQVSGYIDPVMADFIERSIVKAADDHAAALVIQLDSPGSLLGPAALARLERRIRADHRVPVGVWVGPSRARVKGGAMRVLRAADIVGVAPGIRFGNATPGIDNTPDPLAHRTINDRTALSTGEAQINAPVLGFFVTELDGRTVDGFTLDTAKAVTRDGRRGLAPYPVRFAKLDALPRLLHTVTSPTVAYLLLVIAMGLVVFEFFTGGVGIAAAVAIASFVLSAYGLGLLPTRPLALVLLGLSMFGFAVDIQAGSPRFWTGVAVVSFGLGSLLLFGDGISVPLYWVAIMAVLLVVFMLNGMPSMVRTRFATPTVGREGMIGEVGEATEAVDPDGVVVVHGAPWRARTNRATPIPAGGPVRVVAIDGLLLEVEPLEGAARDAGH